MMRALGYAALTLGVSVTLACGAPAASDWILGDSLGVGVTLAQQQALASKQKGGPKQKVEPPIAEGSLRIRDTGKIVAQINKVPPGATAFLVLGTNDALGTLKDIDKDIDKIVQAADERGVKLFWIGPPCVRKPWNKTVGELDKILATQLANTSVKYVSTHWDDSLCGLLARDGVHMTMKGYGQLWGRGRMAAGLPIDPSIQIAAAPPPKNQPGSVEPLKPATPPVEAEPAPATGTPPAAPQQQAGSPPATTVPPTPTPPPAATDTPPQVPPPQQAATPAPAATPLAATPAPTVVVRRPPPEPRRVVDRAPGVRVVVTPGVIMSAPGLQPIGSIRIALGLGPDPYLEPPFPLRRR